MTPAHVYSNPRAIAQRAHALASGELRSKVVRADQAVLCCEIERARVLGQIQALISELIGAIDHLPSGVALALAPGPIRIITIEETAIGSAALGLAVVIAAAAEAYALSQAAAAYTAFGAVGNVIAALISSTTGSGCEACIRTRVLEQSKRAVLEKGPHRTRKPS